VKRLFTVAVAAVLGVAWFAATGSTNAKHGQVAAIFGNAQFIVPGEDVKLGGVAIGKIARVELDPVKRARVVMDIDPRFAGFRADAHCSIEPQSVIGERFVQCSPGTPAHPPLRTVSGIPTVPVEQTSAPVDLDLVLATFRGSRGERLQLLLNELGAGLAGRGDDLNETVRRAAPALEGTRQMLDVVNGQRARIAPLITQAEQLVSDLDRGGDRIARFVTDARRVAEVTAQREAALRTGVRQLPSFLREWRPALDAFGELASSAGPVVTDLTDAAPQLDRLAKSLPDLSRAGAPALHALAGASRSGTAAVPSLRPVARRLGVFAATSSPVSSGLRVLAENLRDRGVLEGATRFIFNATGIVARFDRIAHIAVAEGIVNDCAVYVTSPGRAACNGHFGGDVAGGTTARPTAKRRRPSSDRPAGGRGPAKAPAPSAEGQKPATSPEIKVPGLPPIKLPPVAGDVPKTVNDLLDFLLGDGSTR
jgi:virulence factor Mce-like protein